MFDISAGVRCRTDTRVKMNLRRKFFPLPSVILSLLFTAVSTKSLRFSEDGRKMMVDAVQEYFPHENVLCVVTPDEDELLPAFNLPVVVFTRDRLLQDCGRNPIEQDGYVFVTSDAETLEQQIVPLLKCFNRTTFRLKTKYILVLDVSENSTSNSCEPYSDFFHSLWRNFGIINIAIIPVRSQNQKTEPPHILSYNPFLAWHNSSSPSALRRSLTQDVRSTMMDRFRNIHGHRLRTVFFNIPSSRVTPEDFNEKQALGSEPGMLFKQILEENLNASFDGYEFSSSDAYGLMNGTARGVVGDFINGKADLSVNFFFIQPGIPWSKQIQLIPTGFDLNLVFVVPKPEKIESWLFFLYIFQWQVCVGLGIVLVLLSVATVLFVRVHSGTDTLSRNAISEVVSVWKSALSMPINRLPTTHSQRLLIALSLLLGLIFLTLFSVQLFTLIKTKPRLASIRTLQDLHDSNLPIYTIWKEFAQYLNSFENTSLRRLKDDLKTDEMYENAHFLDPRYLNITDRSVVYTDIMINLLVSFPKNKAVLECFEVVKETIFKALLVMYLPVGSVYYDRFNDVNHRLVSGGFYRKWYDAKTQRTVERYAASSPTPSASTAVGGVTARQTDDDRVPLTYDDLKMAFYILYTGLTVSALCFLKEVCKF